MGCNVHQSQAAAEADVAALKAQGFLASVQQGPRQVKPVLPERFWQELSALRTPLSRAVVGLAVAKYGHSNGRALQQAWHDAMCCRLGQELFMAAQAMEKEFLLWVPQPTVWLVYYDKPQPARVEDRSHDPQDDHVGWGYGDD